MLISSGIEFQNYQKAYDEILLQMQEIKNGNITDVEYHAAISNIINGIRSMADSAIQMHEYYLGQLLVGNFDDMEEFVEKIISVKKEDVIKVSENIKLNTVYFLKNRDATTIVSNSVTGGETL